MPHVTVSRIARITIAIVDPFKSLLLLFSLKSLLLLLPGSEPALLVGKDGNELMDGVEVGAGKGFARRDGDGLMDGVEVGAGKGFARRDGDELMLVLEVGAGKGFARRDGDGLMDGVAVGVGKRFTSKVYSLKKSTDPNPVTGSQPKVVLNP